MARMATPLDYWLLGFRTAQMMAEAQMVIGFRLMGMAGGWPVLPSESARMVQEKGPAFVKAAGAATAAAMKGTPRSDRRGGASPHRDQDTRQRAPALEGPEQMTMAA